MDGNETWEMTKPPKQGTALHFLTRCEAQVANEPPDDLIAVSTSLLGLIRRFDNRY
jgi:hypothetical protein